MGAVHTSASKPQTRLAWLDGLRGIAVIFILVAHYFPSPLPGEYATPVAYARRAIHLTFTGIDLFFVLSGFFVGGILVRTWGAGRPDKDFYLRRAARILPLAAVCIGLTYVGLSLGYHDNFTLADVERNYPWWTYVAFVSNWPLAYNLEWGSGSPLAHLWSLGVEMQFYLAAPLLFLLLRSPVRVGVFLVTLGLGSRLLLLALAPEAGFATHFLPFCRADSFGLGILAAGWLANGKPSPWLETRRPALLSGWILCGGGMLALTAKNVGPHDILLAGFGYTIIAGFFMLSILLLAGRPDSLPRRLLTRPWLVRFGTYSYFIYMFQDLTARLVGHGYKLVPDLPVDGLRFALFPLATGILLLLAPLSWKYLEAPFIRLATQYGISR